MKKTLYQHGTWKINMDKSIALCEQYSNGFERNFVRKLIEMQEVRIAFLDCFFEYFMSTSIFNTPFTFRHYLEAFNEKLEYAALFDKPLTTKHYFKVDKNLGIISIHKDILCNEISFYTFEILDVSNKYFSVLIREENIYIVWEFDADRAHFPIGYVSLDEIMNKALEIFPDENK